MSIISGLESTTSSNHRNLESLDPESFTYAINHVFFPLELPVNDDYSLEKDLSLVSVACTVAHAYAPRVRETSGEDRWHHITKMLDNLKSSVQSEHLVKEHIISQLRGIQTGDILVFFARPQNIAIMLRKQEDCTLFELFEVSPSRKGQSAEIPGSSTSTFPWSAVETPNEVFDNTNFLPELANFLTSPSDVNAFFSTRSALLQHVTTLLCSILRGVGRTANATRITKRVRQDVDMRYWGRSCLWLLVRVAIQMSVDRSSLGRATYKEFMLYVICTLARDANVTRLSGGTLHVVAFKILRRLGKHGSLTPIWLSEMALKTCARLREILDVRWKQLSIRPSPFQNPSQDELVRDTRLMLSYSREYIRAILTNPGVERPRTPFHPSHRRRGTIEEFLSSNGTLFTEACCTDRHVALHDLKRSVEQGLDEWLGRVTDVDNACGQLAALMDQTLDRQRLHVSDPQGSFVRCLATIELFIAIDKLVIKEIPMLSDYSPEIPLALLEEMIPCGITSIHRLSCAYSYLAARHARSRPGWSLLSNEFTEDSFPVRFYDQSRHLQQLKARIEENAMTKCLLGRRVPDDAQLSPLPSSSLQVKVVVFELQCPTCVYIWRFAAAVILRYYMNTGIITDTRKYRPLVDIPELQAYLVQPGGLPVSEQFQLAYFYPDISRSNRTLRYVVVKPTAIYVCDPEIWDPHEKTGPLCSNSMYGIRFRYPGGHADHNTSNEVLASQASCPTDSSLDEFITFGHLRSSGSSRWLNILRGLRSRTLNLRHKQVHFLLVQVVLQVGPLDVDAGTWIWHQELQDSSFCGALLDELHSLVADGMGLIDKVLMSSISLLLTRILASSPNEDVSKRTMTLLRRVRRKTFRWVQELSYDLMMEPPNKERKDSLLDMALTCRGTFDVDLTILRDLLHSADDVDTLLACTFFIQILGSRRPLDDHSRLLLDRDKYLSPALEEVLRDVILTDPSDYGVDLAVAKVFASYQPGVRTWEPLQCPNIRWLTCYTKADGKQPSQRVYINLLDGSLRLDDQPFGSLPQGITCHQEFSRLFDDTRRDFFSQPSDLPEMDFMTLAITSGYKVHFSLRGDNLVVQAQCRRTNEVLRLIPLKIFQKDLPRVLVDNHVHWLNVSTKIIEIRPLKRLWEQSSENWRIDYGSEQLHAHKGHDVLVDIRSNTWAALAKCFECFVTERKEPEWKKDEALTNNIIVTASLDDIIQPTSTRQLSVTLPRYGLSFFANEKEELESRDFKGMIYDENQCVGTLFGLESLLVLRPKTHLAGYIIPEALIPRRVLIPHGFPRKRSNHQIWLDDLETFADEPLCHTYVVDTELGCLKGNGNSSSMRLLSYLHATTVCYRPDPLTGKLGTQEAITFLQSGACRSVIQDKTLSSNRPRGDSYHPGPWSLTIYPPMNIIHDAIQNRYDWRFDKQDRADQSDPGSDIRAAELDEERVTMPRAAHLFPPTTAALISMEAYGNVRYSLAEPGSGLQDIIPSDEHAPVQITLDYLLSSRSPPELPCRSILRKAAQTTNDVPGLDRLFPLLQADSPFQQEYLALLQSSTGVRTTYRVAANDHIDALQKHYAKCRTDYMGALGRLKKILGPTTDYEQALEQFGQWPPITTDVLLRCLASTSPTKLPGLWKKCLVSLALLLLELQRGRRLLRFTLDGLEDDFRKELESEQCEGWDPEEYPDWLLIQVEGNFLIRRIQAETALEMISPRSKQNTVMQINMGEGKSSIIIPIIAAALADGKNLVRVLVPKPLRVQMLELLVARLGGLTNRPIYYLPFSRTEYTESRGRFRIKNLHKVMSQCMAEGGVLLIQPEQAVSLKLMCVEKQIRAGNPNSQLTTKYQRLVGNHIKPSVSLAPFTDEGPIGGILRWIGRFPAQLRKKDIVGTHRPHAKQSKSNDGPDALESPSEWLGFQKWIESHARDILDENDEILHPRFQLIYTAGLEQHVDGYPYRWTTIQHVLRLIKNCACTLSRNHSDSVEYEQGPLGSFPHIHIVRTSNVGQRLTSMIVENVMAGLLPNFHFQSTSPALHRAIRSFISDKNVLQVSDTVRQVEEYAKHSNQDYLWNGLLLLRGLLSSNILLFALTERRWRVNYGLLPQIWVPYYGFIQTGTMLAVPYRAKDVPAPDTQFGHPDLTIILTCLSYYYTGLTKDQLRVSFQILFDQDDPFAEYALWIEDYDLWGLPKSLRKLSDINLRSSEQWDKVIFPLYSRNQATINFYLARVVFPKEAKQFPWKICGSYWDLGEKREKLITGFSGTSDGRWLLPTSVTQYDLDHQRGSNTSVLACLLQPENDSYAITHENGRRWTTLELLRSVATQQPVIRVFLDVGAQILDFSNDQAAKAWLDIAHDAAGAIYFSEGDELMVLTRNGSAGLLSLLPSSQHLDDFVVYLDHAHIRGTDLKFPVGTRAAVTLGPKVTKDALVQGCMRMRKLGRGHSLMFFAPPGVDQSIRAASGKQDPTIPVTTADILCWAIHETWTDIHQRAPHWAQQGINHKTRYDAWSRFCKNDLNPDQLSEAWLQPDAKSLAELYAPRETENVSIDLSTVPGMQQQCKDLGVLSIPRGQLEEEEEREVNRERERERHVEELPPEAEPEQHFLHPDVVSFIRTGIIHSGNAFLPLFTTLDKSSAASREADVWSPFILATTDFSRTTKPESTEGSTDQYLRPVQWIVSSKIKREPVLVVISPFELDKLLPDIRASKHVRLHLYAPRTARRMKPSDDLRLYTIPPLPSDWTPPWELIDQLNVFAGQLYLRDYESYLRLCGFLGVPTNESPSNSTKVRRNLFNIPGALEEMEITFSDSPLPSVMALVVIRQRGRPIAHTHMGKILQGQILTEKDFEVPRSLIPDSIALP